MLQRRVVLVSAILLLFSSSLCLAAQGTQAKPLTNADVIKMVKAGLDESTILLAIKNRTSQFDTSPDALIDLKTQGVPQNVINAMLGAHAPATTGLDSASPTNGANAAGKWRVIEDKSAFDDTKTVTLVLDANERINGPVKSFLPRLIVRCRERDTAVFVGTGMPASVEYGTETHGVRLRIDDGKTTTDAWSESTSNDSLFAPQGMVLLRQLVSGKHLAFEFTPFDAPPQVAQFDIDGLGPMLAGAKDACGWDKVFSSYAASGGNAAGNPGPAPNPECPIAISKVDPFAVVMFSAHSIQLKITYQNTNSKEIVGANFGGTFFDSNFQKSATSDAYISKERVKPGETKITGFSNVDMHKKIPGISNRKGEVYLLTATFADGSTWQDNGSKSCKGRNW